MSKYHLQEQASKASGVTYEASLVASRLVPSLYERIGTEAGFQHLSQLFYDSVYDGGGASGGGGGGGADHDSDSGGSNPDDTDDSGDDDDAWFRGIFSSSTKVEAIDNQYRFLVQTFGGPELYRQKKSGAGCGRASGAGPRHHPRLVGRHAAYPIGTAAAERWMWHMHRAVTRHDILRHDLVARKALLDYFTYTAHYIVVASEYMRPDQLSGGTQMDEGRVW